MIKYRLCPLVLPLLLTMAGPDSGVDPTPDSGTDDPNGSDDGCGCRSTSPSGSANLLLLLLAAGLLLLRKVLIP